MATLPQLPRCRSEAARDIIGDVGVEKFIQAIAHGTGSGDVIAGDFADADEIAIRGRDKDFVGGVQVFGTKRLLDDGNAGFRRDFHEDAARDAFEAAGVQRRREDLAVFDGEDICGSAFGHFATLVEHDDFVESLPRSLRNGPNIIEPRDALYSGHGRRGVAAVFAEGEAHNFAMLGETGGVNDKVNLRMLFVALPEADRVVDKIDARATFGYLVGANHFVKMDAYFGRGVGHGKAGNGGVFFEAAPVALVGESLAARDAQRGENAPPADETGLSGRKTDFLDGQQSVVVKNVRVNQQCLVARASDLSILYPKIVGEPRTPAFSRLKSKEGGPKPAPSESKV